MIAYFWTCPKCKLERGELSVLGLIIVTCPVCKTSLHAMKNGTWSLQDLVGTVTKVVTHKSPYHDAHEMVDCPACIEMKKCGLTFEETHSSFMKDHLLIEENGKQRYVKNPHI